MDFLASSPQRMPDPTMLSYLWEHLGEKKGLVKVLKDGEIVTIQKLWKMMFVSPPHDAYTSTPNESDCIKDLLEFVVRAYGFKDFDFAKMRRSKIVIEDLYKFLKYAQAQSSRAIVPHGVSSPMEAPKIPASNNKRVEDEASKLKRIYKSTLDDFDFDERQKQELIDVMTAFSHARNTESLQKKKGRPPKSSCTNSSPSSTPKRKYNMTKSKLVNGRVDGKTMIDILVSHGLPPKGTVEEKASWIAKYWKSNPSEIAKLSKDIIRNVAEKLCGEDIPTNLNKEELTSMIKDECGLA